MSTYEISKSSLLSLKAEILRKQNELTKTKVQNNIRIAQHIKNNTPLDIKNKGIEKRIFNDVEEEEDLLKKSRDALEAKAKLYDKLSKSKVTDDDVEELNKKYLVQFNKKEKDVDAKFYSESEDEIVEEDYEEVTNPDEEWVEYTDCLGRTRECLRKDLQHIKRNDEELRQRMDGRENRNVEHDDKKTEIPTEEKDVDEVPFNQNSELLSSDMRRELLRSQWEKEEEELKNKSNVHYQDILFNEARTHGVGYYQFSKDEEIRKSQQEALKNLRKDTEDQQKRAQELKNRREKQLKARIKAARNRKRVRMGLQPEEESDNEVVVENPAPKPTVEVQETSTEAKEKEEARKNHIRPWDIGKKGVKEHYVHTQEEWVAKKRKERPNEFAPPTDYKGHNESRTSLKSTKKRSYSSDDSDKDERTNVNPYKFSRNTQANNFKATPFVNEMSSESDGESVTENRKEEKPYRKRAEIAPPASYQPFCTSKSSTKRPSGNIAESIDAGLKFLRMQAEKSTRSSSDDTFLN